MKFKSKSLISIILSIMMVMSMILVAIPANAAVVDSEPVGAGSYYLWYALNKDNPADINSKEEMISSGENIYEATITFNSSSWHRVLLNTSSTAANDSEAKVWTSSAIKYTVNSDISSQLSVAVKEHSGFHMLEITPNTSSSLPVKFSYSSRDGLTISDGSAITKPTTEPTTEPTTTIPVSTTTYYYSYYDGKNNQYEPMKPMVNNNGVYTFEPSSSQLGNTDNIAKFKITTSNDKTLDPIPANNSGYCVNFNSPTITTSTAMQNAHITAQILSDDEFQDVQISDKSKEYVITFTPDTNNPLTGTISIDLKTSATDPTDPTEPTTVPSGAYIITDATTDLNGSLSFSASGGTAAGTANSGDTVTITGNPVKSYFELDTVTVTGTGADNSSIQVSGTGNTRTFTMPAQNVTAKATFKLNKSAYIQSLNEDGLWIDVAPEKYDTTATLIKWNNYTGSNHGTNSYYTFYVPKNVDLTNAKVYNGYNSDVVLNSVTIHANSCNTAPLNIPAGTYSTSGATSESVKVMQGSTNAMFLHTTDNTGADYDLPTQIDSKLTTKSTVETSGGLCTTMVLNSDGTSTISSAMALDTVKGRGNSSWEASYKLFGKYAFNMKLGSKTKLFGMDSAKSWCLLANNADESMLRNALTYQLAAEIGIQDSPEFRFVDIYDNGEYLGSYLVTEKVDVGKSKLVKGESFEDLNEKGAEADGATEVKEDTVKSTYSYGGSAYSMQYAQVSPNGVTSDSAKYPSKTKGKYLLEFEIKTRLFPSDGEETNKSSEASWFRSPRGQYVVVKSPEFATKEQVEFIAGKFAEMEAKVFTAKAAKSDLSTVMDVESFAKMYLIQEFSSNLDSAATSYYMTFDCAQTNPVFVANPVWDYDWAYGQYEKQVKKDVNNNLLKSADPRAWFAKSKQIGDNEADGNNKYSIQSQLATNNSDFKSVVRKVWEETNGFYNKIQTYYAADGQIDTWYKQIKDSVDMNETRWGFIANDPLIKGESGNSNDSWGSKNTGANHEEAVNYLKTDWTKTRATWLNTELTKESEYKTYIPDVPTIMLCDANGNAISAVEQGKGFIIKVTSPVENNVVYRFFTSDGTQVGADQSDGILEIATDDLTVGETYKYKVQAVYKGNASADSATVSVRIDDKAGNKQVTIYFKSASASVYVPSLSIDGAAAAEMTRDKKTEASDGTYFGSTYSGSLKFYWFYTKMTLDTSVEHTLKFTTKDNRVNASMSYEFVASEGNNYYFAVDNLMGDTNLINLTGLDEYIRNYHISATHMVHSTTYDNNVGFTWVKDAEGNYKEYAMGTYLKDNNISTASLTDLTSSSLLTIPSALTPNAMLEASSAPSFFTIKSATLAQNITAEIEEVSTLQYQLLDVNLDGKVDVKDSTMMQKALAGL